LICQWWWWLPSKDVLGSALLLAPWQPTVLSMEALVTTWTRYVIS
jgi:hypothetical protein